MHSTGDVANFAFREATIEHRLRNVFVSILGNGQLLEYAVDDPLARGRLSRILGAVRNGIELLDSIRNQPER